MTIQRIDQYWARFFGLNLRDFLNCGITVVPHARIACDLKTQRTKVSSRTPIFRGRGYGKAVVSASVQHAMGKGYLLIYQTLMSNVPAVRIAQSLGFREYGQSVAVRFKKETQ